MESDKMTVYTPPSLYFRHWDTIIGENLHRFQTLMLDKDDVKALKKFLRRVKEVNVTVGIAYDDEKMSEGKYYIRFYDASDFEDNEFNPPYELPEQLDK